MSVVDNVVEDVYLFADEQKAKDRLADEFVHLASCVMNMTEVEAREVLANELRGTEGRSICYERVDIYVNKAEEEPKDNSAKNKLPFRRR